MADIDPLNASTRESVTQRVRDATALSSDYDAAKATGSLTPYVPKIVQYDREAYGDAIQRKANKALTGRISDLQAVEKASYIPKTFQKRQQAMNQGIGVYKFDLAREAALRELQAKRDAQRSSILGSVLGAAGAVAGAYFGTQAGGPGGGMAGAQAGGAAGSAIGSQFGG